MNQYRIIYSNLIGGSKFKCMLCEKKETMACSICNIFFYCGTDHQRQDWKSHKKICPLFKNLYEKTPESKSQIINLFQKIIYDDNGEIKIDIDDLTTLLNKLNSTKIKYDIVNFLNIIIRVFELNTSLKYIIEIEIFNIISVFSNDMNSLDILLNIIEWSFKNLSRSNIDDQTNGIYSKALTLKVIRWILVENLTIEIIKEIRLNLLKNNDDQILVPETENTNLTIEGINQFRKIRIDGMMAIKKFNSYDEIPPDIISEFDEDEKLLIKNKIYSIIDSTNHLDLIWNDRKDKIHSLIFSPQSTLFHITHLLETRLLLVCNDQRLFKANRYLGAAYIQALMAWIHPFKYGNGRVTRFISAVYLIKHGYRPHYLTPDNNTQWNDIISKATIFMDEKYYSEEEGDKLNYLLEEVKNHANLYHTINIEGNKIREKVKKNTLTEDDILEGQKIEAQLEQWNIKHDEITKRGEEEEAKEENKPIGPKKLTEDSTDEDIQEIETFLIKENPHILELAEFLKN